MPTARLAITKPSPVPLLALSRDPSTRKNGLEDSFDGIFRLRHDSLPHRSLRSARRNSSEVLFGQSEPRGGCIQP